MIAVERSFAVDHPTAAGHFPGHPIIPGAVLLDQVIRVLQEALQEELPTLEIRAAKFLHPVRPGDTMQILIDVLSATDYTFQCKVQQITAASGTIRLPAPKPRLP